MTAYVTHTDMRLYLDKIPAGAPTDTLLDTIGVRATDMVNTELQFAFDGYTTATDRIVYGTGNPYLYLPYHRIGSVTAISWGPSGNLTDWVEQDDGRVFRTTVDIYSYNPFNSPAQRNSYGWTSGAYRVTADWGYGAVPDAVKEVALEVAVNIYRSRDKGLWTDVIGVEGSGGIRYIGGFTKQQAEILKKTQDKYLGQVIIA